VADKRKIDSRPNGRNASGSRRRNALFPAATPVAGLPDDYKETLSEIKRRIQEERLRVVLAANSAMILLYWDIGRMILERQNRAGWGAKVIDRLAKDLRDAFPDMRGFSPRNLKYMRAFAAARPEPEIVQRVIAQLPWRQNIALIERLADDFLRHPDDKPTIGLLLCRSKNRIVVEYALRNLRRPIGVAQWETSIVKALPKEFKGILPTVEEIEAELSGEETT
jgi:predicted nuclease of restriction endonuclease-like (RecB) superfamily